MAVVAALATTATHLFMHFVLPLVTTSYSQNLVIGEAVALAAEAIAYWRLSRPPELSRAMIASALANSASFAAGLLIF